ncbi:MAG: hypothetical protein ACYCSN_14590 [Acidobacteriaceae bacterium]
MSRYNWDKIDKSYNWIAKDSNGMVEAYRERPTLRERCWDSGGGSEQLGYSQPWESDNDWKDSLEERPKAPKRYEIELGRRWMDAYIMDTAACHGLTMGEVVDRLNEYEEGKR